MKIEVAKQDVKKYETRLVMPPQPKAEAELDAEEGGGK
jgi:hypothetical protein